ncbi:MAG TPA: polysaccharide biosynthesis tyrosine autokinase [Phycisphaerae bacterium]|nr:polysaccharide biosynthesis tyrosine autokinase [Phycisphaerae bacterium]
MADLGGSFTCLLQQMGNRKGNVIVVTSAERGVGKTTVSTMLARSLAKSGKRALLIDADLRNPSVAAHMDLHPLIGFAEAVSGQATDSEAIVSTDDPRLDVLPGRKSSDGFDPELIANGMFSSALARWRASYDVILLDSPPVLAAADASILARHADGVILIAWAGRTQRSEIMHAMESLNSAGGSLMGTIFIQQRHRSRYGQPYSYDYGA